MNILLVNNTNPKDPKKDYSSLGGVEYHRMMKPHNFIRKHDPDWDLYIFNKGVILTEDAVADEVLKQTDLAIFCRSIDRVDRIDATLDKLNNLGIPFGVDIDDYWRLPKYHILYDEYENNGGADAIEKSLRVAHFVTCTTPYLAEKIKPLNNNVYVIENGVDTLDPVWRPNKTESGRIRFGFTQGNTHFEDIKTISESVAKSFKDIKFYNKAQVVLTGFYGDNWKYPTIEQNYEAMLTDNLKALRFYPEYLYDLKIFHHSKETNAPYRRIWAKDVLEFATVYDEIDISVAPLIENEFNSCKSELKMIEAGFKDCAIMVNHVKPYTLLATDKNSFDLNKKTFYEWQRIILNNPSLVEDKKAQLKEDVKKYDLKNLTEKRKQLYLKYKKHEKITARAAS